MVETKTSPEEALAPIRVAPIDKNLFAIAQARLDSLTKPVGSLGRLEELAARIVATTGRTDPAIEKKVIFVFAADHGVTEENVSAYPREVTVQMVYNFLGGGAAINVLARHAGAEVVVVDVGVDHDFAGIEGLIHRKVVKGTRNFLKGSAMTRAEAVRTIEVGRELAHAYAERGYQLFGTGDMGIGNTTASSAVAAVLTNVAVSLVTGRGTGVSDAGLRRKIEVIEQAIQRSTADARDPVDVVSKFGGAEIGAICGLVMGAAEKGVPVVIDGFISTTGALVAYATQPMVADFLFAAHNSVEIGHKVILERMGLEPLLDLGLRLGEGTGAALAMMLMDAAVRIYREMATFEEAGVSEKSVPT